MNVTTVNPAALTGTGMGMDMLGKALMALDLGRTKPAKNPVSRDMEQLGDAYIKQVDKHGSGRKAPGIDLKTNVPKPGLGGYADAMFSSNTYAGNAPIPSGYRININPNADSSYLAHELGHVAAQQTDVGKFISDMRHNPRLNNALVKGAALTIPAGTLAAMTDGDEDLSQSVLLSLAASAPELLDEMNASVKGLQMMDSAGMRSRLPGAAARMAGGLMTYAATPILVAGAANFAGNQFDDPAQTDGTLMP